MTEHTPGPWQRYRRASTHSYNIGSENVIVARLVGTGPESDANAELIAAAPEMAARIRKYEMFLMRISSCTEDTPFQREATDLLAERHGFGMQRPGDA